MDTNELIDRLIDLGFDPMGGVTVTDWLITRTECLQEKVNAYEKREARKHYTIEGIVDADRKLIEGAIMDVKSDDNEWLSNILEPLEGHRVCVSIEVVGD